MPKLLMNLSSEHELINGQIHTIEYFTIENATNFSVSSNAIHTEVAFDDPMNYCYIEDAPVLRGTWTIVEQTKNKIILKNNNG